MVPPSSLRRARIRIGSSLWRASHLHVRRAREALVHVGDGAPRMTGRGGLLGLRPREGNAANQRVFNPPLQITGAMAIFDLPLHAAMAINDGRNNHSDPGAVPGASTWDRTSAESRFERGRK